jgi:copper ion binding protein
MTTSTYAVTGMTCEHCVRAVSEEVRRIEGVSDVTVDLPSGALTISSTGPIEEAAVAEAVEEAGYQLAAR